MPDDRSMGRALHPYALAAALMACAGALTGLTLARPTPMTAANAILFWVWAATAVRFARMRTDQRICAACGAIDPLRLPDGACAACAAPVKRCFPDLVPTPKARDEHKPTSW